MAGTVADRRLSPAGTVRFALATAADDPAIRRLLRRNPMAGAIRLTFEREPDYFRGTGVAGAEDQTVVAFSGDQLVCMGRCTWRETWVDGAPKPAGYLAELRLDASARGRFGILRDGYRFFHEGPAWADPHGCFTSIAADNLPARRLLERGLRGMPRYRFLAELTTLLVAVPRRPRAVFLAAVPATPDDLPSVARLLNDQARRCQLGAVWTVDRLRALAEHGLPVERFLMVRRGGKPLACGALWDQRSFRQTVIRGYSRGLALARPVVNLGARLLGTPRLPPVGAALAHALLSPLAFAEDEAGLLPEFVAACLPWARQAGVEYLTLALPTTDPRLLQLRRQFTTRAYRSRLYQVSAPGGAPRDFRDVDKPFLPDVGLL